MPVKHELYQELNAFIKNTIKTNELVRESVSTTDMIIYKVFN